MSQQPKICISVVSHNQGALVAGLLSDLQIHCLVPLEVILTINVPEVLPFDATAFGFPIRVITNAISKGFGTNHNAAFRAATADFFCVLNPDIRLEHDPFPPLLDALSNSANGVAAPLIVSPAGNIEDSARRFPTPWLILKKMVFGVRSIDYEIGLDPVHPDWVGGMFMVFSSPIFRQIDGFDEKYYLYYEDADLCWRLHRQGYLTTLVPVTRAIHAAQRTSHRKLRYLAWHASSMLRFFRKSCLSIH